MMMGIELSTPRFAQLLKDAQGWDQRYVGMRHAQTEWLLENFCFGDQLCVHATLEESQAMGIYPN